MNDTPAPALPDAPKTTTYELSTAAVFLLENILAGGAWYKDESKPVALMNRAYVALEALPEVPAQPKPDKEEAQEAFDARVDAWAEPLRAFAWTDKQKAAVTVCVKYHIKQAHLSVNKHTIQLMTLLGLEDE